MRLIIKDLETDTLLYGHQEIQAIIRGGKRVEVKTLGMPIEAYIAFLQVHHQNVPAVQEYLKAVEETGTVFPGGIEHLVAIDDALEITEQDADFLERFIRGQMSSEDN
jgi:hypothetical protein